MNFVFRQKKVLIAFGVALIALSLILVLNKTQQNVLLEEVSLVKSGEKLLVLEVVDSAKSRELGLSDRDALAENMGMLFIFDKPGIHGIWMKDMKFSIDIIWLDSSFQVINFKQDVSPDTYPTAFTPSSPNLYVIEANSGFVEESNIKIGEILQIQKEVHKK